MLSILLVIGLFPTWLRTLPPPDVDWQELRIIRLKPEFPDNQKPELGPFHLEGIWHLTSRNRNFGGYSALLPGDKGQLLALSDQGYSLNFSPPGSIWTQPRLKRIATDYAQFKENRDAESATRDPVSGTVWIGWEHDNAISRHSVRLTSLARVKPKLMQDWSSNSGPEAMVRLADGRFIVLREGFTSRWEWELHSGILFSGDPTSKTAALPFTFSGPSGYSPTDMTQLPDGRVLILMRKISLWPPIKFDCLIVLADPAMINPAKPWTSQIVARLPGGDLTDNFEGIAVVPAEVQPKNTGPTQPVTSTIWLISDDNNGALQRTLLWKLSLDPAQLPKAKARLKRPS